MASVILTLPFSMLIFGQYQSSEKLMLRQHNFINVHFPLSLEKGGEWLPVKK